jgi:serine/threonine protein kinase
LIKELLEKDPKKRITADEIFDHPWMQNIDTTSNSNLLILLVEVFSDIEREKMVENFGINFNHFKSVQSVVNIENEIDLGAAIDGNQESFIYNFTEQPMETTMDPLKRNATTKSVILAPFNSTFAKTFTEWSDSVMELIVKKDDVITFGIRAKELDRQYEINNNCELDNGVYNNFAYKSPTSDGEGAPVEYINWEEKEDKYKKEMKQKMDQARSKYTDQELMKFAEMIAKKEGELSEEQILALAGAGYI